MNDIRRTILWVIFGFSMVLLWDQWQVFNGQKAPFFPSSSQTAKAPDAPAPVALTGNSAAVPSSMTPGVAATPSAVPTGAPSDAPAASKERVVVNTDVLALTFDSEGGTLVRSVFSKYKDLTDKDAGFVLLDEDSKRVYVAQTGLIAGVAGGELPTHKTVMTLLPGDRTLGDGQNEIQVKFESQDIGGVKLVKTYTLKRGSYEIAVRHDIVNTGDSAVAPQLYMQLVRDGNAPVNNIPAPKLLHFFGMKNMPSFYSTFTGPAVYTEAKKYQKVEFKTIEKNEVDVEKQATNGYVAMVQHYFASAWILPDGVKRDLFLRKVDTNLYAVGMIAPIESIAPGTTKSIDSKLFVGPQEEKTLEAITPGLEQGVFKHGQDEGDHPKITEMRARLKDKPQEMQQAMMKIYREEKVNPVGGCFPIMIQIPVFIALYWVLLSSVEMRNAPWILWIQDLSAPDPYFILPVVMTMTTLLQTALNPAPPDPMQAKLMWFMPLIFSVMFFFFPSGLVLYWITNNILSIAQQWMINTRMGVPPQFNLPKFK